MSNYKPIDDTISKPSAYIQCLQMVSMDGIIGFQKKPNSPHTILKFDEPIVDNIITIPSLTYNSKISLCRNDETNYEIPSQIGQGGKFLKTNGNSLLWADTSGGGGNMIISESNIITVINPNETEIINYPLSLNNVYYIKIRYVIKDLNNTLNFGFIEDVTMISYNGQTITTFNIDNKKYSNNLPINNISYSYNLISSALVIKIGGLDNYTLRISAYCEFIY